MKEEEIKKIIDELHDEVSKNHIANLEQQIDLVQKAFLKGLEIGRFGKLLN
jgi:hypothetical protein